MTTSRSDREIAPEVADLRRSFELYDGADEETLQQMAANVLDLSGLLWWHTPNGGKRSKYTAGRLKAAGVKPGVPDIIIADLRSVGARPAGARQAAPAAIEIKTRRGVVSPEQRAMLRDLEGLGWRVRVARGGINLFEALYELEPGAIGLAAHRRLLGDAR